MYDENQRKITVFGRDFALPEWFRMPRRGTGDPDRDDRGGEGESHEARHWGFYVAGGLIVVLLLAVPSIMVLNYGFPALSAPSTVPTERNVAGLAYVDALLSVYNEGMRPWLPNDRFYPTILLDNPQNFQLGELEAMRYAVRILRDHLSRLRSTDAIDRDVETAFTSLSIAAGAWWFPRAEEQYGNAMDSLRKYRARLIAGDAHFYPRADNLVELLNQFNSLTGGANTRLYNCVGDLGVRVSSETGDDPYLKGESVIRVEVAWSEVDDQFYYARGVAFVYREVMVAISRDFREVLEQRNADEFVRSIVTDFLDYAQFEPIYVANGGYGSLWANHPYQLLGLLSQVRERSRSLVTMLSVNVH